MGGVSADAPVLTVLSRIGVLPNLLVSHAHPLTPQFSSSGGPRSVFDAPALGSGRVNWRAAFAGERVGLPAGQTGDGFTVKGRTELAGGEGVESAEACGKFDGGQAAFAVERAEKILGGALAFL
jgi:hypothetical protein